MSVMGWQNWVGNVQAIMQQYLSTYPVDTHPLKPCCAAFVVSQVLLCEETVSLLGIRQFYRLVGDVKPTLSTAAAALAASSNSSANGTSSTAAAAARGPAAAQDSTAPIAAGSLPLPSPLQASQPAAGDAPASAEATSSSSAANVLVPADIAATQQQRQQQQKQQQKQQKQQNAQGAEAGESQEPQLSIAEQQQLLLLKVEALLQLLFSVSFHQVCRQRACPCVYEVQ
jgi:hypothetical protein